MHNLDRLGLLDTFVQIADSGSMRKAAQVLGVTQPTVSRRLSELERLLGARLATRSTSHFSLTDEGTMVLAEARQLSDHWLSIEHSLGGRRAEPEGTLRVTAPSAYGTTFLTDVVCAMLGKYPKLTVELRLLDHSPDYRTSPADCWVVVGEVRNPELIVVRIGTMARQVVAAPALLAGLAGGVTPQTVARLPWIELMPYQNGEIELFDTASDRRVQFEPHIPLRTDSLLASYRAVLNGVGMAASAPWMCEEDVRAGRLAWVLPGWSLTPVEINVAVPARLYRPARVAVFLQELRQRMAVLPGFVPAWPADTAS